MLLKTLVDRSFHLFLRTKSIYITATQICSFTTIRFYFGFQEFFILDRFAIKFFYTIADFIPNIFVFF